jgi:hypothetical protein
MELTFARWDLVGGDLPATPVLRVLANGLIATDAEYSDCFVSPLVAAEAVWRVVGDKPASGSWLDAAYRTLDGASVGPLRRNADPAPRVITSELIETGGVTWVNRKLSLAPTGNWALASQAGLPLGATGVPAEVDRPAESGRPLSGTVTGEWALASAAGIPQAEPSESAPDLEPASPDHQLSGDLTAEWALVRHAVQAAGAPEKGKESAVLSSARPAGSDKPLSGTSTQEWSFAGNAGLDPVDE